MLRIWKGIRNVSLIIFLFFFGCYMADGKETWKNMNEKVENAYHRIVSSHAYEEIIHSLFYKK